MHKNINLGIKISIRNFNFLDEIYANRDLIDFIEIILLPDFNEEDLNSIKNLKLPYVIHLPNSNNRIDFGNINWQNNNLRFIQKINQFENVIIKLKPICYIIHPESGDINLSISNIKQLNLKPLAIENMPLKSLLGGDLLGYDVKNLRNYFKCINELEFCFDINHAIKAAISLNVDYLNFIKKFLTFKKPIIFHISGGNLNIETDEHLSLDKSKYPLSKIKKILFKFGSVVNLTFETPRNYKKYIEDDLKNIRFFINS